MKPIIVDMKDMSDSTEVYESKANPFLIYTIYSILFMIVVAIVWMCLSKIDIVVKSNGMFKSSQEIYEVSSGVTGKIDMSNVKDGQFVNKGDILFVVNGEILNENIKVYQDELADINERIEILKAYSRWLDGDENSLESLKENQYFQEFIDRKNLLLNVIDTDGQDIQGQKEIYQKNIDSIIESIQQYKDKISKLEQTKKCIQNRNNEFNEQDNYYNCIVSSYISNYSLIESQYDLQIEDLSKNGENAAFKIESLKKEKEQALSNAELQQISGLEQQIESINDSILSLDSNLVSTQLQLQNFEKTDDSKDRTMKNLTEKGNVTAELLTYQNKAEECTNQLNHYNIQNNNCTITANASGYFYLEQSMKQGSYVQEGMNIGKIYPKETEEYYAEVYVENSDVAKLKIGQNVKFEIAAYPSREYGYFTGKVDSIPKDISFDDTGNAYYLVRVSCDDIVIKNREGSTGKLINGMACQAKIITDEENVLRHLLEKIDLLD